MIQRWSNTIHFFPFFKLLVNDLNSSRHDELSQRWWKFCKSEINRIYWDNYPEEYQQEIRGIADGVSKANVKLFGNKITCEDILALNEMYEYMVKLENIKGGIHPLRSFWDSIKQLIPGLSEEDGDEFISTFLAQPKTDHCDGFIATGDATTDGQIVISQALRCGGNHPGWYSFYIAERWNVILDILPEEGNRVIMATSPGYIWSDENYYQNSNGIVLIDTQYMIGYWKNTGFPFAIRTRKAAQYSDSIDQAISHIRYNSDGIWPAAWLIGDTKTGEIARADIGYKTYEVWRTKNGFYWSANNVMSKEVRAESLGLGIQGSILRFLNALFKVETYHQYFTRQYIPCPDDLKFEELGEKYYGKIDTEVVKKIMTAYPIADENTVDCKITDSYLVKNNGLWAFFGNLYGDILNASNLKSKSKGVKDVPPGGWVLLYGLPENHDYNLQTQTNNDLGFADETDIIWRFETENLSNHVSPKVTCSDEMVYVTTDSGRIYALSKDTGIQRWVKSVGEKTSAPSAYDDMVFVGSDEGLKALTDKGEVEWVKNVSSISSKPVIYDENVIVGTDTGEIYAVNIENGEKVWKLILESNDSVIISNIEDGKICAVYNSTCVLIDAEEGDVEWYFEADGPITSAPKIQDDAVYLGCWDTKLYSLDVRNGEVLYEFMTGWGVDTTPVVSDDMVFFGSMDNSFYAIDAETGEQEWFFNCQAGIHSSPVVYGNSVFFGCDDGRFYALDKTNGNISWVFTPGYSLQGDVYNYVTTPILSDPIIDENRVIFSAQGTVYSLDTKAYGLNIRPVSYTHLRAHET